MDINKRVQEIAIELTKVRSVVDTKGEVAVANKVYELISNIQYFKDNPNNLRFIDIENDTLGRKNVFAFLDTKKSKDTVVTIGHIDTVGVSDYGSLIDIATDPIALTQEMKKSNIESVKNDALSNKYLFGRGIFDMKSGDAVLIALLEYYSDHLDELKGNMIYIAVCDEEGNSRGMLNSIKPLLDLRNSEKLNYLALLDTDYITEEYEGDENKYIYIGTVGKIMPSFYIVGKETHVGESYKGLDPNQIGSEIIRRINLNTDFSDVVDGEVSLPPITLKVRDLKTEYSVQTAKTSNIYFNYATHSSTPDEVMDKMLKVANDSFQEVLDTLNERYKKYCSLSNRTYSKLPFETKVISFKELFDLVLLEKGEEFKKAYKNLEEKLEKDNSLDQRDKSMKLVELTHNYWSYKHPVIIVYFTPPYYPHVYIDEKEEKGLNLINAVKNAVDTTKVGYKLSYKKFFPYISDLSYGSSPKDPKIIETFKTNTPGFGTIYDLPLEDMADLDLPVLDIGCFGKDAHKFTERVEIDYSYKVVPELVHKTINNLFK